jgi:hypothetical protein
MTIIVLKLPDVKAEPEGACAVSPIIERLGGKQNEKRAENGLGEIFRAKNGHKGAARRNKSGAAAQ